MDLGSSGFVWNQNSSSIMKPFDLPGGSVFIECSNVGMLQTIIQQILRFIYLLQRVHLRGSSQKKTRPEQDLWDTLTE